MSNLTHFKNEMVHLFFPKEGTQKTTELLLIYLIFHNFLNKLKIISSRAIMNRIE